MTSETNNTSRQFLTLDSDVSSMEPAKSKQGTFCSYVNIFIGVLVAAAVAAAVGLIVHFAHPARHQQCQCTPSVVVPTSPASPQPDLNATWETCCAIGNDQGHCLPGCDCPTTTPAPTTPAPPALTGLRLPNTYIPYHYNLEIKPHFYSGPAADFYLEGKTDIFIECRNVTDNGVIFIHIRDLEINNSSVTVTNADNGAYIPYTGISLDIPREFYKIHLATPLPTLGTKIKVSMNYTGKVYQNFRGLFSTSYKYNNATHYMLATQLESTYARQTFPCLDEPALRATFNMTMIRKDGWIALANMPNATTMQRDADWIATTYETTTETMPTYLVAFAFCQYGYHYDLSPTKNFLMGYWAPPHQVDFLDHARNISGAILEWFEIEFNEPYTWPKTDQISVPNFASGAMENWGLITYRPTRLLYDSNYDSYYTRQRASGTISHELLHQWLGNMVTCDWWDDIWLQEGMARYYQHLGVDSVRRNWDLEHIFILQAFRRVLRLDARGNGQPVYTPVETPREIQGMFSVYTYDKGGSIIRMMATFLGNSTFRKGMREYVQRRKYNSAKHDHLFDALNDAALNDSLGLHDTVNEIMYTWIKQMGYPLVTATRNGNTITLSQKYFLLIPRGEIQERYPSPYNYTWDIPVWYIKSDSQQWDNPDVTWLLKNGQDVTIQSVPTGLFIANIRQLGYFRMNYDVSSWNTIIDQFNSNHSVIDVINRAQLIDDANEIVRTDELDQMIGIRLTEYLSNETEYLPWSDADYHLLSVDFKLYSSPYYALFRTYLTNLLKNNYVRLTWTQTAGERLMNNYLRVLTLARSCYYGNEDCLAQAASEFARWKSSPDPSNATNKPWTDIRDVVFCNGVRGGGSSNWDFVLERFKKEEQPSEKQRLQGALSCTTEAWLLNRLMHLAAFDNEISDTLMVDVAGTNPGRYVAWEFIREYWGNLTNTKYVVLRTVGDRFSSEYEYNQLETFIDNLRQANDAHIWESTYQGILRNAQYNVRWRNRYQHQVASWLRDAISRQT